MLSLSWCRKSSRQALLPWLPEAARFSFCKHSSSFPPDCAGLLSLRAKIATPFGVAIFLGRRQENILPSAAIESFRMPIRMIQRSSRSLLIPCRAVLYA